MEKPQTDTRVIARLARAQRILAALEIFSLVLWVGGLFFLAAVALRGSEYVAQSQRELSRQILAQLAPRFHRMEAVFAAVVLISNFMKTVIFGRMLLQRFALMVSALMLIFMISYSVVLPARAERARDQAAAAQVNREQATGSLNRSDRERILLMQLNCFLGLFLVYAHRSFEERKLNALVRIFSSGGSS